jgi:hypothetical protein
MSNDIDDDLKDLNPDDLDSIVRWSRKHQFRSRRYEEEPTPKPQPQQTDADAAAISKQWVRYIDDCINKALNNFFDNIEAELNKNFATLDDLKSMREEMRREVSRASNKLIIFDAADARARKHLDDDPQKVVRWDDVRKRG